MAKLSCFITSIIVAVLFWGIPIIGPAAAALAFFSANTIGMAIAAWVDRQDQEPVYFQKSELTSEQYAGSVADKHLTFVKVTNVQVDGRSVHIHQEPKHFSAEVKP